MALSAAEQARLDQLKQARDDLLMGVRVGRFRDSDGVETEYANMTESDRRRLYAAIAELEAKAAGAARRGPARVLW
ncbi:gpW family head-tail joining protein [Candidatus Macondimonas diazotrophica]|jgi:hypothetical protein|uniref:Uncharacterized protein n=1 Tax=Candidatus Macondimonas diazotrophica TaxID=2305248 RepID=A0A4Z0F6T9_9GAMM|nr:gpW family head-tail joining protein [Candidatus Macondimonas diazotrophica]NCU02000.1 hypothetical protein [Candidatus Macondimonas diazotrophica]TFZ81344.1 hypothetical protein E4680_12860 [Candidatus Macondimonas diazotrophica]